MTSSLTVGPAFYGCYLLHSDARRANRHYIGSTPDPARRLRQHNGLVVGGAKKTRAWRPWEMQLLIYGFTSKLSALQFEWAWQHPDKTRHLAGALGPKAHQGGAAQKVLVARKLMTVPPFAGQPLHVLAFSERYGALFLSAGGGSGGGGAKGGRGEPKKSKTKTTTTSKPPSPLPPPPPPGGRSRRSGPAASQGGQGPRRREEEGGVRGPLLPEGVAQEEEEEDGLLPLRPLATVRLRIEGVDGRRRAVIGGGDSRLIQQRGQPAPAPSKGTKTTRSTAATGSKRNRKGTRTVTQHDDDDRGENKGGGGDRGDEGEGEVDESDSHGGGLGPLQVDDGSFARAHWEKYERFLDSLTGPAAAAAACDPAVLETTTTTGAVDGRTSTDDLTTASSAAKQPPPLDELAVGPTTPCCTLCSRSVDLSKPGTFVLCPSSADPAGSDAAAGGDEMETDHARLLGGGRSFFPSPCPPLFPSVSSPRAVSTTADGGNADGRGGARPVVLSTTGPCQALTHLTCLARHFLTAPNPACSTLQRPLASTSALTGPPTPSTTTTTTTPTTVAAIGTALTSRSSPAPARLVPLEGTCPACTEPQEWGVVVRSLWAIGRGRQGEFDPDLQRTGWRGGRGGGRRPRKLEGKGKAKAVHETTDEASNDDDDDNDDDGRLSVADSVTAEATAATGGTTTGAESDEAADEDAVQYTAGRTSRRQEQEQQHSPPTQAASHKERSTTGRGRGVNAIDTARSLADRLRFPNRKRRAASSSSSSPANEAEDDDRAGGEDLPTLLASATIRTPSPSKASAEKRARRRRPTGGAASPPSGDKRAVGGPNQSDERVKRVHKGWLGGPSPVLDVSPPKASSRVKGKAKERAGTGDDEWEVLADDYPSDLVTPRPSKLTRTKPLAAASSQGRPVRLGTASAGSADAAQGYLSIDDESDDNFPFDILPRSRRPPEPPTPSSALSDLVLTSPPSAAIASLAGPSDQLRPAPAAGRKRPSLPLETDADLAPPAAKRQSPAQVPVSSRTAATAGKPKPLYVELSDSD